MENDDFRKNIDELFWLFKRLVEKHPIEDLPGMNQMQFDQLKMFLNQYESMKDSISFELVSQVNEPMKQMLLLFIKQLREQLGEEAFENATRIEAVPAEIDKAQNIRKIDELLAQPGLTESEIDDLLDQRLTLKQQLSENTPF